MSVDSNVSSNKTKFLLGEEKGLMLVMFPKYRSLFSSEKSFTMPISEKSFLKYLGSTNIRMFVAN